jgi:hypothetical protein
MLKLMMLCLVISALSGCAHRQPPPVQDTACVAFDIIRPSRADTPETKRQVLQHNTTLRRVCPQK